MLFSELYSVDNPESEEWFDPILHQDTKLFIDPFLIFKTNHPLFSDVYDEMMEFINDVFNLIAKSGGNKRDINYKKAVSMLRFHEVNELCLGYSTNRNGAGPGPKWSETIASNISRCIDYSIFELDHMEEIGLFSIGIGPDSISDITANIMKDKLVVYTQKICKTHDIPMKETILKNASFNKKFRQWETEKVLLPVNPYKDRSTGILLVPEIFLRELPTINKDDFLSSIMENSILRSDLNFEIDQNLKKEDIAKIALENYKIVKEYTRKVESRNGTPYDLIKDPKMLYKWYIIAQSITNSNPISIKDPTSKEEFLELVFKMAETFKNYVENKSGYKLLWDEKFTKGKSEESVQLLFNGIVEQYCVANGIDLTREVNQGRGPVDFRFSSGYQNRVLLEIKLARNSKFWHGLEAQLPKYLEIDKLKEGIFLVVIYNENDQKRVKDINSRVSRVNREQNLKIKTIIVDATPQKPSASNL
ncbi:hypothetical protein [Lederbergia citri]|uniref:Uncharacterized protein n=1 Tax=Lederbergia citri TaxID=2833580 RepID=A0A942TAT6_9BACI|nr:hypothetical protein [Lederbergia citri]MBS4194310.1 hypothetical protein [Lederbergia citri]